MAEPHLTLVSTPENTLKVYSLYRLILSALLLTLYLAGVASEVLGTTHPRLFVTVVAFYLAASAITHFYFHLNRYAVSAYSQLLMLIIDITALTTITHASGGLQSGLGYLLLVAVASASISLRGQLAYFLAALATISVLTETGIATLEQTQTTRDSVSAGVLGMLLFVTVFTFQMLAARARAAQELAITREVEAADLQRLNEAIIRNMHTGIIVIDSNDTIRLINSAAIQLLGGQQTGRPLGINQSIRTLSSLYRQLKHWRVYPWMRTPTFTPEGGYTRIQANFTSLSTGGEENRQILIFLEDTRTLAQYAQQLKLSSLGRLTGSIAHEIRNPLGAISHASQLLSELPVDEQQKNLIEIIDRQTKRVNQIIENVMQLSRQRNPEFQKISLTPWLKKYRTERQQETNDDAVIEIFEESHDETRVFFDPSHLLQVLNNLFENAFRHSKQATGIAKATLKTGTDPISGLPFLDVIDNGPGIPKREQDKVFDPFFTTSSQGSGLGLYVSKQLCEVNYATLSYLESEDPGAHFRIGFSHPDRLLPRYNDE